MTAEKTKKIRDGDTLIVDAVLCRKTETGEIGWYDHVTEKFHPTPTPTPEISGGYLQWVENGVQYIDTGIAPASLRPKGEWITMSYWKKRRGHHVQYVVKKCSLCNFRVKARWDNNFCPNCGADMRGESDGT